MTEIIAAAGAGRMGRGLAIVFAYAGHQVRLVDLKPRDNAAEWLDGARAEIASTLQMLVDCNMIGAQDVDPIASRIA